MNVTRFKSLVTAAIAWDKHASEETGDDPAAATRRAIVRAAAIVGKAMP